MIIIDLFTDNSVGISDLRGDESFAVSGDDRPGLGYAERLKTTLNSAIDLTNREVAKRVREVFGETPYGEEFAKWVEQGGIIPTAKIWDHKTERFVGAGPALENVEAARELAGKLVGAGA